MSEFDSKSGDSKSASEPSPKAEADSAVNKALSTSGSGFDGGGGATFHDDSTSHAAADAVGARAFTAGSDVYFGQGNYQPDTPSGSELISHEMIHVQQSESVAAPEPGNFRVSSPSESAETDAASGTSGGTAPAHTILRDGEGPSDTSGTGPAAEGEGGVAAGPGGGGDSEGDDPEDPYEAWKAAASSFQTEQANTKWGKVPSGDKSKFCAEDGNFKRRVIYVMKESSVQVFKESGDDINAGTLPYFLFAQDEFEKFLPEMKKHAFLDRFLEADPKTTHLSSGQVAKLKTWSDAASGASQAKKIFEKAYPTLHDSFPSDSSGKSGRTAKAWTEALIKRLFNAMVMMPVGHVSTVTGGFVLMAGSGNGFWRTSERRVFLSESSGLGTRHRMSGGSGVGLDKDGNSTGTAIDPSFKGADGTKKSANMDIMEATFLHEIGHGVGARLDGGRGNAYAEDPGSWPGWTTSMDFDTWADELWRDGATGSGSEPVVESNAKLDDEHAKEFVKAELKNGRDSYSPGWGSDAPRAQIARYVKWRYISVPLVKWWDYFVERGQDAGNSYRWDEPDARIVGDWTYARLTRGGAGWTKYKKQAWDQKVSWYSLSSPREWFAEQYTQFYRTEKTGSGIDSSTLSLLKDLDEKEFVPTDSDGDGVTIENSSGGDGGDSGGDAAGAGGGEGDSGGVRDAGGDTAAASSAGADSSASEEGNDRPLFFSW